MATNTAYMLIGKVLVNFMVVALGVVKIKKARGFPPGALAAYFQDLFLVRSEPDRNNYFAADRFVALFRGFPGLHIFKYSEG